MSKAGALDLATGLGGKIEKNEVLSAVEQYVKFDLFFVFVFFGSGFDDVELIM